MSHINLYSLPTDAKNMIRCRFCEKIYKIDNGSSGFIRHLRCKHPDVLFRMGGAMGSTDLHTWQHREPKIIRLDERKVGRKEEETEEREEMSSNEILANIVSQMDFSQNVNRVIDNKRAIVSPVLPKTVPASNNSCSPIPDDEPELKVFSGRETLHNFLIDIDNQVRRKRELQELNGTPVNGGTEAASTSEGTTADVTAGSIKDSREQTPNSSLMGEMNGSSEATSSPVVHHYPFGCVICPCSFPRIRDLTVHVEHAHRTRFRCNTCLAEFVQPGHLEQHFLIAHVTGGTVTN